MSGSLVSGRSLAQVLQFATMFSICIESPGHRTDARALARHLIVSR